MSEQVEIPNKAAMPTGMVCICRVSMGLKENYPASYFHPTFSCCTKKKIMKDLSFSAKRHNTLFYRLCPPALYHRPSEERLKCCTSLERCGLPSNLRCQKKIKRRRKVEHTNSLKLSTLEVVQKLSSVPWVVPFWLSVPPVTYSSELAVSTS